MSKNRKSGIETPLIKHRVIVPIQTRGNIGKSTEVIARAAWMTHRDVPWRGFDLDVHNRTFSDNYPDQVTLVECNQTEPEGDIIKILRKATQAEVTTIDPQAHMNATILRALEMIQFTESVGETGVRLTVLVYPIDETTDLDDITSTVEKLGDKADWVIVRNPARQPRTKLFDGSELERELLELGAATLRLPALLTDTRNVLRAHEAKLGRAISPSEAVVNREIGLDPSHRMIVSTWLKEAFKGFDAIAAHLLPRDRALSVTEKMATTETTTPAPRRRGGKINVGAIE